MVAAGGGVRPGEVAMLQQVGISSGWVQRGEFLLLLYIADLAIAGRASGQGRGRSCCSVPAGKSGEGDYGGSTCSPF